MSDREIGRIEKGKTADLRLRLSEYQGRQHVDLRTIVVVDATGDQAPTRKGVTLPPTKLLEIRALVDRAIREAAAIGLIDDTGRDDVAAAIQAMANQITKPFPPSYAGIDFPRVSNAL